MTWRVKLNRPHVDLLVRVLSFWFTLVAMALIFGPRPRLDELLFGIFLPLTVLVPG